MKYFKKLSLLSILLASFTSPLYAETLNIQVGFQQANDGSGDLLGALTYVSSPIFGSPSSLFTYIYGPSNPTAYPYPFFPNDAAARTYYDAIVGPSFLSNANVSTVAGTFNAYAIEAGTIMQVNSNWLQTNVQAPDYIIGKPTDDTAFTNGAGYITSSALSGYATTSALTSRLATKFTIPTGTTSQYLDGTGTPRNFTSSSRTFNYPSRSLNTCYQISSTNDADYHYGIDVSTGLSLTSGAQGTVTPVSYTNSSCTTGAQNLPDGTSGQSGTLVVGLGINQVMTVFLNGTLAAGKWIKLTTVNTSGTPTYSIRANQEETILP